MAVTRKEAFRDCLYQLCGGLLPPDDLIPEQSWSALDDDRSHKLQDWVSMHIGFPWGTGIGTLEAIDVMVTVAEDNGNLRDSASFLSVLEDVKRLANRKPK